MRPILAVLLLAFGLSGCYTKFFADDELRPTSDTYAESTYSSDMPESSATVMIQEYIVPDLYPTLTWRTWGFSPFWYEPWFNPFFVSPWWSVGYVWLPYWTPHRAWYWNGYLGWTGWGWSTPLFWGSPNAVILPVFPASAHSSIMRPFGRIRQGSLSPDAVQTPRDMETVSPNRSSSEVAPDKRAPQRSEPRNYHTLPRVSNSPSSTSGSSSGLRPSSSSGSMIQQSSGSLPSRSSSGSSSPSSTSGTRTSGRNR